MAAEISMECVGVRPQTVGDARLRSCTPTRQWRLLHSSPAGQQSPGWAQRGPAPPAPQPAPAAAAAPEAVALPAAEGRVLPHPGCWESPSQKALHLAGDRNRKKCVGICLLADLGWNSRSIASGLHSGLHWHSARHCK